MDTKIYIILAVVLKKWSGKIKKTKKDGLLIGFTYVLKKSGFPDFFWFLSTLLKSKNVDMENKD